MFVGWFVLFVTNTYDQLVNDAPPKSAAWLGEAGVLIFGAAWLWSLFTSVRILRSVKTPEPSSPPPRLG
jgi:hypothetical protein